MFCRDLGARMSQPGKGLSEEEQRERRAAMPAIFARTPFMSWLGLVVERYEPDDVATRLPFRVELSNDGSTYHGGVVSAVIDTTGALAAWSNHDFDRGMRASTVSMALQYVAGSSGGDSCVPRCPSAAPGSSSSLRSPRPMSQAGCSRTDCRPTASPESSPVRPT